MIYLTSDESEREGYTLQITNSGSETAEDVAAHIGFREKIIDYEIFDPENTPPLPPTEVEITDNGTARIRTEYVRRDILEHFNPIFVNLFIEEGTESNHAFNLGSNEEMFAVYEYSWTFLGARYYESTDNHVVRAD